MARHVQCHSGNRDINFGRAYIRPYVVYANSEDSSVTVHLCKPCADPEGAGSGQPPPPLENHKAIGFFSNIGLVPLENHKATKPAFNLGHYRPVFETPFELCFAGGPMMTHF